ncbi:hypothetical protein ELOC111193_08375 [Elizabethkingia occulta]|uniref:Uncharacterized protein n=1 Tax=Elizabethkingia occulta TaxID=1867263 RepID=A0A1T3MZM9_9FLAO|nr:hypothetical protein [Elizabethkingia occulta]OPB87229.1 hypothetical protein BB020_05045 [Elizabethkingia occulta]OPC69820.1 hypothetical protein BAZ10_18310 [Elizabethkingia occulta]
MKKIIFIILIVLTSLANAQTVDDIKISDLKSEYIAVRFSPRLISSNIQIEINYGQSSDWLSSYKSSPVLDENKKKKNFNSIVSAINFLSDQGYMLITSTTEVYNQQSTNYFFFRKKEVLIKQQSSETTNKQ